MEEPEIKIDSNKGRENQKKKNSVIKVILIILAIFILAVGGGIYYLKSTYSEGYLKSLCESEISKATGGNCKIERIDWSLSGQVQLSGLSLELNKTSASSPQFLKVKKVNAEIEVINSIINFQPVIIVDIDGIDLNIERVVKAETGVVSNSVISTKQNTINALTIDDGDKFSTNINRLLASFADLPWKNWVADFNWKIADIDAKIRNVNVNVHDHSNLLKSVHFTLDTLARLKKTGVTVGINIGQETPDVKNGGVKFQAKIIFDWDAAANRADKPLAFIGSTNINLDIKDLDIGYIGKYYIQSTDQAVRLADPISGLVSVKAEDLSKVNLQINLKSKKIVQFYRKNKVLKGGAPGLEFNLKADTDLSQEWSNIRSGSVEISSTNSDTRGKWVDLNTQISGSFGNEIITSIQGNIDVGAISSSAIGKALDLYNLARGDIILGSDFTWKKSDDWGYDFNIRSKDLVVKNNGASVAAPITMLISGKVKAIDQFTPEFLTLQAKCNAPGIQINTLNGDGVVIPLSSNKLSFQGEAKARISVPEVFKAFEAPLSKLGLKSIDEVLDLTFNVDQGNSVSVAVEMNNTKKQYEPCEIKVVYSPKADNKFDGSFEVTAEKKAVQLKATVEGTKEQNGATALTFNKQFAFRMGSGINLIKRIQNLVPGLRVAQYPVAGVMRGTVAGKALINHDEISVAANSSILVENAIFTTDSGRKFTDNKTSITSSFILKDLLNTQVLSVKSIKVKGDTADIDFKVGRIGLSEISKNLLVGLDGIKDLRAVIKLGEKAFSNLYALLGDSVPAAVKTGKNLIVEIDSRQDGSIALNKFDLNSTGIIAKITELVINPKKIIDALGNSDVGAILASLSPFKVDIKAGADFWKGLTLPQGMEYSGNAELAFAFDPKLDRLTLSRFILAGDRNNKAFITRLSAATIIDNISKLAKTPELSLILESLPSGVNIPVVTISVPLLKQYLLSNGTTLDLRGNDLELSNLRMVKAKSKGTIQLAGKINSSGFGIDDMLVYKGSTKLNNLISLEGKNVAVTGEMNFDEAQIKLKATPYVYNKLGNQKVKLYYKLDSRESGLVNVYRVSLTGGALQFDLQDLKYQPKGNNKFMLSLPKFRVLAPIDLVAKDIVVNPDQDIVTASIMSKKIDLDKMRASLDTGLPSTLGGYIGAMNLQINDKYSTLLGGIKHKFSAGNKVAVNPSSVSLKSTNSPVSMTVGVGKIQGNTEKGKIMVGGLSITSPSGFSEPTPIKVGQIDLALNLDAIAQGKNIIDEMIVSSFKAIYEMKVGGNSISALQKNIDTLLPASSGTQGTVAKADVQVGKSKGKVANDNVVVSDQKNGVLIKNLYLNNGVVSIKSKIINTSIKIPQTHVKDIGGNNPRVAFTTVLNIMLRSIGTAALSILDNSAGTAVKSVTNLLGNALNNSNKSGSEGSASSGEDDPVKSVSNLLNSVINSESNNKDSKDNSSEKDLLKNLFK